MQVGQNTSSVITLSTGPPQGCVLSPLLLTLMTHDYVPQVCHQTQPVGGLVPEQKSDPECG